MISRQSRSPRRRSWRASVQRPGAVPESYSSAVGQTAIVDSRVASAASRASAASHASAHPGSPASAGTLVAPASAAAGVRSRTTAMTAGCDPASFRCPGRSRRRTASARPCPKSLKTRQRSNSPPFAKTGSYPRSGPSACAPAPRRVHRAPGRCTRVSCGPGASPPCPPPRRTRAPPSRGQTPPAGPRSEAYTPGTAPGRTGRWPAPSSAPAAPCAGSRPGWRTSGAVACGPRPSGTNAKSGETAEAPRRRARRRRATPPRRQSRTTAHPPTRPSRARRRVRG